MPTFLSPEDIKDFARFKGLVPDEVDFNQFTGEFSPRVKVQPAMTTTAAKEPSISETVGRSAALSVIPSAASMPPSIAAGLRTSAYLAAMPWTKFHPAAAIGIPLVGGLGVGLATGLGIGGATQYGQAKILEQTESGADFLAKERAGREANPISASVGDVAGSLVALRPNMQMLKDARLALTTEARAGAGLGNKLLNSEAAQQVGLSGALGGAGSVVQDLAEGKDVNIQKALVNTILQGAVADVQPWISKIPALSAAAYRGQPLGDVRTVNWVEGVERSVPLDPAVVKANDALRAEAQAKIDNEIANQAAFETTAKLQMDAETDVVLKAIKQKDDDDYRALQIKEINAKRAEYNKLEKKLKAAEDKLTTAVELRSTDEANQFSTAKAEQQGVDTFTLDNTGKIDSKSGDTYGNMAVDAAGKTSVRASTFAADINAKGKPESNLPEVVIRRDTPMKGAPDSSGVPGLKAPAATTPVHEILHKSFYNMTDSASPKQAQMGREIQSAVETSPEFASWKAKKTVAELAKMPNPAEEFLTINSAVAFHNNPSNKGRSWKAENDALNRLKAGKGTMKDAVDINLMKFRYDVGTSPNKGSVVTRSSVPAGEAEEKPVVAPKTDLDLAVENITKHTQDFYNSNPELGQFTRNPFEVNEWPVKLEMELLGQKRTTVSNRRGAWKELNKANPGELSYFDYIKANLPKEPRVSKEDRVKIVERQVVDPVTKQVEVIKEEEVVDVFGDTKLNAGSSRLSEYREWYVNNKILAGDVDSRTIDDAGVASKNVTKETITQAKLRLNDKLDSDIIEAVENVMFSKQKASVLLKIFKTDGYSAVRTSDEYQNIMGDVFASLENKGVSKDGAVKDASKRAQTVLNKYADMAVEEAIVPKQSMDAESPFGDDGGTSSLGEMLSNKDLTTSPQAMANADNAAALESKTSAAIRAYYAKIDKKSIVDKSAIPKKGETVKRLNVKDLQLEERIKQDAREELIDSLYNADVSPREVDKILQKVEADKQHEAQADAPYTVEASLLDKQTARTLNVRDAKQPVQQEKSTAGEILDTWQDYGYSEKPDYKEATKYLRTLSKDKIVEPQWLHKFFDLPTRDSAPSDKTVEFSTDAEKQLRSNAPFGLKPGKDGNFTQSDIMAKMRALPQSEQEMLSGFKEWLAPQVRVNAADAVTWLKENGPKVEVRNYGMEGKVTAAKQEYDAMTHDWYDTLSQRQKEQYEINNTPSVLRNAGGWTDEQIAKAQKYSELSKKLDEDGYEKASGPRATTAYRGVSAWDGKVPEWTLRAREAIAKGEELPENKQRVDVVIPNKPRNQRTQEESEKAWLSTGRHENEADLWMQDNLHENLPNTLGWAMIQYKTGPEKVTWEGRKARVIAEHPDDSRFVKVIMEDGSQIAKDQAEDIANGKTENKAAMYVEKSGIKKSGGEKIAVIAEAQSRWGQRVRAEQERINEAVAKGKTPAMRQAMLDKQKHPLLADTNRLILKAAIDQAHKEGATHIFVSDAQTAMLTEKLDYTGYVVRDEAGVIQSKHDNRIDADTVVRRNPGLVVSEEVDRLKGFQHNYDGSLPRIATDLTGDEGVRMSLGEHKNAVTGELLPDNATAQQRLELNRWLTEHPNELPPKRPRPNLVFANPDGTPKTDITGRLYDISLPKSRLESGEQMTLAGKRYSTPDDTGLEFEAPVPKAGDASDVDESKRGFLRSLTGAFDKVAPHSVRVSDAFKATELQKDMNEGKWVNVPVKSFQRQFGDLDPAARTEVYDRILTAYRGDAPIDLSGLSESQVGAAKLFQDVMKDVRVKQVELNMMVETSTGLRREPNLSEWYAPEMLNEEMLKLFTASNDSVTAKRMKSLWADHVMTESRKAGDPLNEDEVTKNIADYVKHIGRGGRMGAEFGALRKSAGYGLPEEMRERDLLSVMTRYGRRASRDMAKFQHLESDEYVAGKLGLKDPITGRTVIDPDGNPIDGNEDVIAAMKYIDGSFDVVRNPRLAAAARTTVNGLLGPLSGARDLSTVPANALPYISNTGDLFTIFSSLKDIPRDWARSLEMGARSGVHRLDAVDAQLDLDGWVRAFNVTSEMLRKYQGRDLIEQVTRGWDFSIGKNLAQRALDSGNEAFIEKFGMLAKDKDGNYDVDVMAKNFVDRTQGTYGGRGLPTGSVDGMAAPWFSLARWSLEKSNVIYQDVVKPAQKGSFGPLLTYALGSFMTGVAIEAMVEEVSAGRKSSSPTFDELKAGKAGADQYTARVVNLMQLGSFGGMFGDVIKMGADISQGQLPRGWTVPLANLVSDGIAQTMFNFVEAVKAGEDPIDTTGILVMELMKQQVQAVRLISNGFDDESVDRKNKFRDMRVYKKVTGQSESTPFIETNPALRPEERAFKRSRSPEESEALMQSIIGKLREKHGNDPERLLKEVRRLRHNSYQTFPNPKENLPEAQRYFKYLTEVYGEDEAQSRLEDYARQGTLNKAKTKALK